MTAAWQDTLRGAWTILAGQPAQARQYRTQPLPRPLPLDAYAALRAADDGPCLLIRSPAPEGALFEVGGMRLSVDSDERGPFMLLSLEDSERRDLFVTVCADAVSAAGPEERQALARLLARLDAWRRFFMREQRKGLGPDETIGLIGELLVLERILSLQPCLQICWKAPEQGLHDFERDGHAIEVKTGMGSSSLLHISSLDQLDTAGVRRLDLAHVRLVGDPDGRSLQDIVAHLETLLTDQAARDMLGNALLRRGLMPDDATARSRPRIRLRSMDVYRVEDGFPRILRGDVPVAVSAALYSLELRAIAGHLTDTDDSFRAFAGGTA